MIEETFEFKEAEAFFKLHNIEATFLKPTETALKKSIIDAIKPVRSFFKKHRFHDYGNQLQGQNNKIAKKGFFINKENIQTLVTLYRPNTKRGDPRIWFTGLKNYIRPGDLLALFLIEDILYILNCSDISVFKGFTQNKKYLNNLDDAYRAPAALDELLEKMHDIYHMGFVDRWGTKGPKAVGWTLESLLGLQPNSSKNPDYKGIELKSHRSKSKTRFTLFSHVPKWSLSRLGGTLEILNERGKFSTKDQRISLYVSLNTKNYNTYNLRLETDYEQNLLHQIYKNGNTKEYDTSWLVTDLFDRLSKKHPNTLWVNVDSKKVNDMESFHYLSGVFTSQPDQEIFKLMLGEGLIELDYTMHIKKDGGPRDHGYLFKILPENLDSLFAFKKEYDFKDSLK